MRPLQASLLSVSLLALASCSPSNAKAEEPILRFTAIPDHNTNHLKQKFDPLADVLSGFQPDEGGGANRGR